MKTLAFLLISLLFVQTAYSESTRDEGYFTIKSISVEKTEILNDESRYLTGDRGTTFCGDTGMSLGEDRELDLEQIEGTIDSVITIGKKIWEIVKAGEPVLNVDGQDDYGAVLPKFKQCWMDYEGWNMPKVFKYTYSLQNLYGSEVIKASIKVVYTYGGSYNGQGKFLTNVKVSPMDVYAAWGFTFDVTSYFNEGFNMGTKADPIAALEINTRFAVKNMVNKTIHEHTLIVTGEGIAQEL